ncbi:MAG: hypothetical protein AAF384_06900 [Pseudomonadota bacterium]
MPNWEAWLVGALALVLVMFWFPSARRMWQNSPDAEPGDWQGVLLPLAAVVGFVLLLIALV